LRKATELIDQRRRKGLLELRKERRSRLNLEQARHKVAYMRHVLRLVTHAAHTRAGGT
jgi:flagellar motor component MotA